MATGIMTKTKNLYMIAVTMMDVIDVQQVVEGRGEYVYRWLSKTHKSQPYEEIVQLGFHF